MLFFYTYFDVILQQDKPRPTMTGLRTYSDTNDCKSDNSIFYYRIHQPCTGLPVVFVCECCVLVVFNNWLQNYMYFFDIKNFNATIFKKNGNLLACMYIYTDNKRYKYI